MTANRTVITSGSGVTGTAIAQDIADEVGALWDRAACTLSSIGGTANAITATCTPSYAALVSGMAFFLTPASGNTGAVTLAINGGAALALKDSFGNALTNGWLVSGALYHIVYNGAAFIIIGSSTLAKINNYQAFSANGTWTKPANCPDDAIVDIEGWGAGAGGGDSGGGVRSCGGGGGGYSFRRMRAGDLASTVAVTVGAGGAKATANGTAGAAGGNSTFGSHLIAYGGGGGFGRGDSSCGGGSGGSTTSAGNAGAISDSGGGAQTGLGYGHHGGRGGDVTNGAAEGSVHGGGGGGGTGLTTPNNGGSSYYGGGGGAARGNGASSSAGTSVRGGNGGAVGTNGTVPGGGGGAFANGARGEIRVWTRG